MDNPSSFSLGLVLKTFFFGLILPVVILVAWMLCTGALKASSTVIMLGVPLFALASALGLWWLLGKRHHLTWADLGFVRPRRSLWHLLWGIPVAMILSVTIVGLVSTGLGLKPAGGEQTKQIIESGISLPVLLIIAVVADLVIPFLEEVMFRGVLFGFFRTRIGAVKAVLVAGVIFALFHVQPTIMLYVLPWGLAVTAMRAWLDSTWASCIMHVFNNTAVTAIAVVSLQ